LTRILIANRGEIAVRIIRACREMGLASVAVYSDCDRTALHVRLADGACRLGGDAPSESYLNIARVIDAARRTGAEAIHPGYGFLAENADLARACAAAGLVFIGPAADVIDLMGSKTSARRVAAEAGVPVVPGSGEPLADDATDEQLARAAGAIGYPLLVKAVEGGGGKGMRRVHGAADLIGQVRLAKSEALTSFGDSRIYFERLLERPRHVEVQLLADGFGTIVPFVERECSIQRRHQKVLEESPSTALAESTRQAMTAAAAAIAARAGYTNAGTIEFLVDETGRWYFLEMNTRLQVEHPVTELVTGVDLVQWQIRIARGERLTVDPSQALTPRGHAIECRIYAEDPEQGFLPSPGRIDGVRPASGPGIREDSGVTAGSLVPVQYDSLVSKLVAWAPDRPSAVARLARALDEHQVSGVRTTIPFFRWLVRQADFAYGRFDTTYLDRVLGERAGRGFGERTDTLDRTAAMAAAIHAYLNPAGRAVESPGASGARSANAWLREGRREALR
jgi:acetyl-CoA carboxylase biotin carboxylase subunit